MAKKWIQGAVKHKGRLRAAAKRMGILKGSGPMSEHMAQEVESRTKDSSLKRAAALGKRLIAGHLKKAK